MPAPILVAYATRSGSTAEIAEAVAKTLRQERLEADLERLREVRSLEGRRAVIVGAPLYMFRWHKDAFAFLARFRSVLGGMPVAVFALGPFHDEEKEWTDVRAQLDRELAKVSWLRPAAQEVFGGRFDPAALRFPMTLIPALRKMPSSDIRDWTAIEGWARRLAARLRSS